MVKTKLMQKLIFSAKELLKLFKITKYTKCKCAFTEVDKNEKGNSTLIIPPQQ